MLPQFNLFRPTDPKEACSLKGRGAMIVAGGTDVYVAMHGGKLRPKELVDIKGIAEMRKMAFDGEAGLTLGALTTHRVIEDWDIVREKYTALFEGCSQVGSVQIRQRGTIGGNICNGAPSADSVGPLIALGAECLIVGEHGQRKVPLYKFFKGPKETVLAADELLYQLLIPPPEADSGSAYIKYTRRKAMDLALLGVSVYLALAKGKIGEARVALSTAAPTPIRAFQTEEMLKGSDPHGVQLAEMGRTAAKEANPRSSWRSSREFRLALIEKLVQRAYTTALARAEGVRK